MLPPLTCTSPFGFAEPKILTLLELVELAFSTGAFARDDPKIPTFVELVTDTVLGIALKPPNRVEVTLPPVTLARSICPVPKILTFELLDTEIELPKRVDPNMPTLLELLTVIREVAAEGIPKASTPSVRPLSP